MTIIIQAVEAGGRSGGRNFSAIEFAGKKSPDLAFSKVGKYGKGPAPTSPAKAATNINLTD